MLRRLPPCLLLFLLLCLELEELRASDAELLLSKVKPALQGWKHANAELATWNASATPLCLWRGLRWSTPDGRPLRCDAGNLSLALLVSIRLPAAGLAGTLPPELGAFSALASVYLAANQLSGAIPLELGNAPALSALDLSGNRLSGPLPASIWNLCDRATELRLHGNALAGPVPAPAGPNATCDGLHVLDLAANRFSGSFPSFLAAFRGLRRLDLSRNNFSGQPPEALSSRFPPEAFQGNAYYTWNSSPPAGHLSSRGVAGLVIGAMAAAVVLASVSIGRWARRGRSTEMEMLDGDDDAAQQRQGSGRLLVFEGGEHLTPEEVLNATGQVVAKATYCTVYKAKLMGTSGASIELRLLREGCCKPDAASCAAAARRIGRARHRNLVPLRAFYHGRRGEKLLVYDHVPRARALSDLLLLQLQPHKEEEEGRARMAWPTTSSSSSSVLTTWPRRHKVALGVARALAYLHAAQGEAHGNVRASTVLVDDMLVPRLAEHALDRLLLPAAAEALLAAAKADGYKAPELHSMAKCSARTDVYAFGILLLELLMGRKPSEDLPSLVKAAVLEETPLEELLDAGMRPEEEGPLLQALKLAMGCCAPVPAARPTMTEVVRQLEDTRPSPTRTRSAMYSPTESRSDAATPTTIAA
ncbi:unnamed protein product [Urochloa decumbens]|uniref:Protein kinase domain-containing protein n=1 Tax=Urochloa decumbens TaxID=240449 RepID=A0ABC9BJL4_9POAL